MLTIRVMGIPRTDPNFNCWMKKESVRSIIRKIQTRRHLVHGGSCWQVRDRVPDKSSGLHELALRLFSHKTQPTLTNITTIYHDVPLSIILRARLCPEQVQYVNLRSSRSYCSNAAPRTRLPLQRLHHPHQYILPTSIKPSSFFQCSERSNRSWMQS